jgi:hypothetical protein
LFAVVAVCEEHALGSSKKGLEEGRRKEKVSWKFWNLTDDCWTTTHYNDAVNV